MVDIAEPQRPARALRRIGDHTPALALATFARVRAAIAPAGVNAPSMRLGLWAPVALGSGAICYLLAATEPPPWFAPLIFAAALGVALVAARGRLIAAGFALFAGGFLVADLRAQSVDAPVLTRDLRFAEVDGRIVTIDEAPSLRRLIIEVSSIEGLEESATPARVRLSWRGKTFDAHPGERVTILASLSPPPRPAAPGGFDFARQLYFQRIGAVGFSVSPPIRVEETDRPFAVDIKAAIESVRVELSRRILEKAPGDSGAIVAAVVTGKREAISERAEAAFRDSGLAHLLSISGLHMGLATGLIFFVTRALLALIEPVALRYPIKKWAAGAALVSGFFYLLISGGAWPAERAFIMSAIFFIAIIFDRRALSLRNVAIAAFVIILRAPEAVLHPGFQMSFAAVTALIAFYEWSLSRADPNRSFSSLARFRRYFFGIVATDTVAATATAPFALYHFNRNANFGLAANLISVPVMGFWVMPAAIIAMLLMPFNVDGPFWRIAAAGVDIMLAMGRWTMSLPGAVTHFPHWPAAALGVLTIGGLWLCLGTGLRRISGLAAVPVAILLINAEPQPRLFFSDDGDNAGVVFRDAIDGRRELAVMDRRKGRFDARVWMERAGIDAENLRPSALSDKAPCDDAGCVLKIAPAPIAISIDPAGLDDDCARAALVIALYPVAARDRAACASRLIDRRDAWENGAHAIYVEGSVIRLQTVGRRRGARPWTNSEHSSTSLVRKAKGDGVAATGKAPL